MQSGGSGESNLVIQKLYPGSGMLVPDDIFFYLKVASWFTNFIWMTIYTNYGIRIPNLYPFIIFIPVLFLRIWNQKAA